MAAQGEIREGEFRTTIEFITEALILCALPVTLMIAGNLVLAVVPQGQELLGSFDELATHEDVPTFFSGGQFVWMEAALLIWALSVWYCCRLLLGYSYRWGRVLPDPQQEPLKTYVAHLRVWMPRVLGALCVAPVPIWYVLADGSHRIAWLLTVPFILFVVMVLGRRRWLVKRNKGHFKFDRLSRTTIVSLLSILATSFSLLILFIWNPTVTGRALGAPAILFFAMSSWVFFGTVALTLLPKMAGLPNLILVPFIAALVISPFNDNHALREVSAPEQAPIERELLPAHLSAWLAARGGSAQDHPYPIIVVATAGGGLRAAYWTASVLAAIDDRTHGAFACHVYAISSVSGGSLGAAAFVAAIADQSGSRCDGSGSASYQPISDGVRTFLGQDYLSPTIGSFLFPDTFQRFLPKPWIKRDRAFAMETSWEKQWRASSLAKSDHFAERFLDLYRSDTARRLPALMLNATTVDEGKRVLVSNLRLAPNPGPIDGFDLLDQERDQPRTQDMPLSTAVHNSARFTYVSPAGTVELKNPAGHNIWGRVVDGGYFDNSGAATAAEVITNLSSALGTSSNIFAIIIRNSTQAKTICKDGVAQSLAERETYPAMPAGSEVTAPVEALLNGREARATLAERDLLKTVGGCNRVIELQPDLAEEPALGWYLDSRTREQIDKNVTAIAQQFVTMNPALAQ